MKKGGNTDTKQKGDKDKGQTENWKEKSAGEKDNKGMELVEKIRDGEMKA